MSFKKCYTIVLLNFLQYIYTLYFLSHNLFGGLKKRHIYKSNGILEISPKKNGILEKINNSYKIIRNKLNISISYS